MADQAALSSVNGARSKGPLSARSGSGGRATGPDRLANDPELSASGVVNNVAGFGENLLTLAELQARLTAIEIRQNLDSLKAGGVLMLVGLLLAIAGMSVLMVGAAELLVSEVGMKRGYALLSAGSLAIVVAGSCLGIARRWLSKSPLGFPVASEEFARNLNWLRTILKHSGRWPSR
jgi:hypothetical protein